MVHITKRPTIQLRERIFPIGGVNQRGEGNSNIYGTASHLGGNYFITAGHVLKSACQLKIPAMGFISDEVCSFQPIVAAEELDHLDVGIIEVVVGDRPVKRDVWDEELGLMTDDVRTFGFPHGQSVKGGEIYTSLRGLKGSIVSLDKDYTYELSFFCPKGLSGAPLLNTKGNVIGIVTGNNGVEMNVCQETEKDGQQIYTKDVIYFMGEAISVAKILEAKSELLGMTIGDFIKKNNEGKL